MNQPEERDLAHEADMEKLRREQLRADITIEEAVEWCAEIEARAEWMDGADLDDGEDMMGDPDEYDEHYCACNAIHCPAELDGGRCWSCGEFIG